MNKRLIIIFVSIAVIVLTLVLGAVIFTVNDVKILVTGDSTVVLDKTGVINASGIKRGTSIFTIDEEEAQKNIEKSYPNTKVVTIERIFPSEIRINIIIRVPILSMKVAGTDKYLVLDREFKILEVVDSSVLAERDLVEINGYDIAIEDASTIDGLAGSFINTSEDIKKVLHETVLALETYGNINERLCAFADSITVADSRNYIYVTTKFGVSLVVRLETTKTVIEQISLVYAKLDSIGDDRVNPWFIFMDSNGEIKFDSVINFNKEV